MDLAIIVSAWPWLIIGLFLGEPIVAIQVIVVSDDAKNGRRRHVYFVDRETACLRSGMLKPSDDDVSDSMRADEAESSEVLLPIWVFSSL